MTRAIRSASHDEPDTDPFGELDEIASEEDLDDDVEEINGFAADASADEETDPWTAPTEKPDADLAAQILKGWEEQSKGMFEQDKRAAEKKPGVLKRFFFEYDATSQEHRPLASRFFLAGVVVLGAAAVGMSSVRGDQTQPAQTAAAEVPADRKSPASKGSNLRRTDTRFTSAGLQPVDQETPEPQPMPEAPPAPQPAAAAPPPAPRPTAPTSWESSISLKLPEVDDGGDEGEEEGPSLAIPEGQKVRATLTTGIEWPEGGIKRVLNRVEAELSTDEVIETSAGPVTLPRGTTFVGEVLENTDKRVVAQFSRFVLPTGEEFACEAVAVDGDTHMGLIADKISKKRVTNWLGRVLKGTADLAAGAATFGRHDASTIAGGAVRGSAEQLAEEAQSMRTPSRWFYVNAGRVLTIKFTKRASL